jgi:hypothetical protein
MDCDLSPTCFIDYIHLSFVNQSPFAPNVDSKIFNVPLPRCRRRFRQSASSRDGRSVLIDCGEITIQRVFNLIRKALLYKLPKQEFGYVAVASVADKTLIAIIFVKFQCYLDVIWRYLIVKADHN